MDTQRDTGRECHGEAEIYVLTNQGIRIASNHQKLGGCRKNPPRMLRESMALRTP